MEGGLRIDQASHQAFMDDHPIELSPVEYRLLLFFMTHPERAYSRARILDHVWGVRGVGYRFIRSAP